MTTYTDTIGAGGAFATLSLWHGTSASVPVSGDVMDVEFLSGTHNIAGTYNNFSATDLTINLKAHASALHNGEWDGPVQITWSTRPDWYFDDQTINLNLNDLVIKMTSDNFFRWHHVGTSGNSANYDSNVTFNRCLISNWSQDYAYISVAYLSLFDGPSSSPTAYGTFKWEMNNCIVEQQNAARSLLYNSDTNVTNPYYAQKRYFNGCTFKNVSFGDRSTDNGPLDIQVSGCLNDSGSTRLVPVTASNYSATVTDYITGETTSNAQFSFWATGTNTNVSTAASFNYDGTVTAGEVCFVGPSGPEGNYRLVADLDNLAVKYFDNNPVAGGDYIPILYRDVANNLRPKDTDAGAFQSISTETVSYEIGASANGHARDGDYASIALWWSDNNSDFLNNITHELTFLSGEHNYPTAVFNNSYTGGGKVSNNIKFIGESFHEGYWDRGTILTFEGITYPNNSAGPINQSIDVTFKDLIIKQSTGNTLLNIDHPYTETVAKDYMYQMTMENCMVSSSRGIFNADDLRNSQVTVKNNVINLSPGTSVFGSVNGKGLSTLKGNTIKVRQGSTFFGIGGTQASGIFEGNIHDNTEGAASKYRPFVRSYSLDYLVYRDNITTERIQQVQQLSGNANTAIVENIATLASFNYDNTVTSGEVCFIGSANGSDLDFRLVASEDNLASGFVSSSDLSGLDLAGNSRGDSPYDAGAFAITLQQAEDFIRSLGGPLVLQVGYRISNNRQRLNVGGGPEE